MDRFPVIIDGDKVIIYKGAQRKAPHGTDTTGQGLEGPHCVIDNFCSSLLPDNGRRLHTVMYAATTERSIAMVLLAVVVVGWAIYVFVNIRRSKREVGSEIELAANRGSLPDDEVLEGSRLEQVQAFGVLMLLIIALVLPIYWLREGGRRAGAEVGFSQRAADAGERLAEELECVVCHGADLGGANYAPVVLDIGNQFSDQDSYIVKTTWPHQRWMTSLLALIPTLKISMRLTKCGKFSTTAEEMPAWDFRRWSPDLPRS